ncbi:MAG: ATP-binding protein [Candidatus Limnocylindrales bacterium]
MRPLLRPHPIRWDRPAGSYLAVGDEIPFPPGPRAAPGERVEVRPHRGWREHRPAWNFGDEIQVYVTDDGPGVPIEGWDSVFEPFARIEGRGRSRGSGIRLFAARRLDDGDGRPDLPRAERVRCTALRGRPAGRLMACGERAGASSVVDGRSRVWRRTKARADGPSADDARPGPGVSSSRAAPGHQPRPTAPRPRP